jgi:hypothetical protein
MRRLGKPPLASRQNVARRFLTLPREAGSQEGGIGLGAVIYKLVDILILWRTRMMLRWGAILIALG